MTVLFIYLYIFGEKKRVSCVNEHRLLAVGSAAYSAFSLCNQNRSLILLMIDEDNLIECPSLVLIEIRKYIVIQVLAISSSPILGLLEFHKL